MKSALLLASLVATAPTAAFAHHHHRRKGDLHCLLPHGDLQPRSLRPTRELGWWWWVRVRSPFLVCLMEMLFPLPTIPTQQSQWVNTRHNRWWSITSHQHHSNKGVVGSLLGWDLAGSWVELLVGMRLEARNPGTPFLAPPSVLLLVP